MIITYCQQTANFGILNCKTQDVAQINYALRFESQTAHGLIANNMLRYTQLKQNKMVYYFFQYPLQIHNKEIVQRIHYHTNSQPRVEKLYVHTLATPYGIS
jgi:hypothetical protein